MKTKDQSQHAPQYFLKYPAPEDGHNTIKINTTFPPVKNNKYEQKRFSEIDRIITCQTPGTMFANKLVALIDRHQKTGAIAGRDVYDIHHFFEQGLDYNKEVIIERTGNSVGEFFNELAKFIEKETTETVINQDLNALLLYEKLKTLRKTLKQETLIFVHNEIKKLKSKQ